MTPTEAPVFWLTALFLLGAYHALDTTDDVIDADLSPDAYTAVDAADTWASAKRGPALSVNRDLSNIAAIMRQLKADRAHSELVNLGKKSIAGGAAEADIVNFLYNYHLNPSLRKQSKKNRLSVDMQLSAISDMLDNQRMMSDQQHAHSALLKIGKRSDEYARLAQLLRYVSK